MSKNIEDVLAEEGSASEGHELPVELPEDVKVTRPNLGRGTVVSVRLSSEEHERLQRAAEAAHLPISTLIRIWTLDRLHREADGGGISVSDRLARLERAVFDRSA